jgi:hypothetical protein
MMKVFVDLGAKTDETDGVLCVAAALFKPHLYKKFIRSWNKIFRGWGSPAFHATDFYPGAKQFKRDTPERRLLFARDCQSIPRIIGQNVERVVLVSFRPNEYEELASPAWKKTFGTSLLSLGLQVCLLEIGWWADETCPRESFAYFMEAGDKDEAAALSGVEGMRRDVKTNAVIRVSSFASKLKGSERGLEAADFLAWHWNKYYMDKIRHGLAGDPRKDFAEMIRTSKSQVFVIFLTGDDLKFFFSRVPKEVLAE